MLRVVGMALMNVIPVVATIFGAAYAVQPGYGVHDKSVYLWIPVVGNIVAVLVIPFCRRSRPIGRRPPIIVGALGRGCSRSAICTRSALRQRPARDRAMSVLMWGIVYQGYNAVFPSFYPELFPTRSRVSAMAIGQEHRHHDHRPAARAVRLASRRPDRRTFPADCRGAAAFARSQSSLRSRRGARARPTALFAPERSRRSRPRRRSTRPSMTGCGGGAWRRRCDAG